MTDSTPESPSHKQSNGNQSTNQSTTTVTFRWPPAEKDFTEEFSSLASSIKINLIRSKPVSQSVSQSINQSNKPKPTSNQSNRSNRDDPLSLTSQSINQSNNDPLSILTASSQSRRASVDPSLPPSINQSINHSDEYECWRSRRERITTRYQTNKKIAVKTAFLDDEKHQSKAGESTKTRLQELIESQENTPSNQSSNLSPNQSISQSGRQSPSNGGITVQMTQSEFLTHISDQSVKLKSAWESGERVLALKIAIQCAKLLGDQSNSQSNVALAFYPSAFVSLTAILDQFGDLVFDRIREKGSESINQSTQQRVASALPKSFGLIDVTVQAQETCRNWFYKTSCIRELLPRLYVDMCMLKCYRFIDDHSNFINQFRRTSAMIRGIGDPLTSLYARAYLAVKMGDFYASFHSDSSRSGESKHITSEHQSILTESFLDFMQVFAHHSTNQFSAVRAVREERCTGDEYVDLMAPAIDWIAQNIGYKASKETYNTVFTVWKEKCNHTALLAPLIDRFPRELIGKTSVQLVSLIFDSVETESATQSINQSTPPPPADGSAPPKLITSLAVGKAQCFAALGRAIVDCPPAQEKHRLAILNEVWKWVTKIQSINQYMELAIIYINFLIKHFSERELNIFMRDLIKHVKPNQLYKYVQHELALILVNLMNQSSNLIKTLKLESFLSVLDLLENRTNFSNQSINQSHSNAKVMAAKIVLITFQSQPFSINPLNEPLINQSMVELCRILHDSVDSLTFEDEKRQISELLIEVIQSVNYDRDVESQLAFYTDCREAFRNLELVLIRLIDLVIELMNKCLTMTNQSINQSNNQSITGYSHNKKSAAFVRACMAYLHITIPSFVDLPMKLNQLLLAAQTGLVHQLIGQSEACIKTAIALIHDSNHEVTREEDSDTKSVSQSVSHVLDAELVRYVGELTQFLLLFPGHPDHGPFYLVTGLINAINAKPQWKISQSNNQSNNQSINNQSLKSRFRIYLGLLTLFFAYSQKHFSYHLFGVDSNDTLYGCDSAYLQQLVDFIDTLMDELIDLIGVLGEKKDLVSKQLVCTMSLEFVNLLIDCMKIETSAHATLIVKLIQLAANSGVQSINQSINQSILATIEHLKTARSPWTNEMLNKLSTITSPASPLTAQTINQSNNQPTKQSVSQPIKRPAVSNPGPVTFGRMPSAGPQARTTGVQGPL